MLKRKNIWDDDTSDSIVNNAATANPMEIASRRKVRAILPATPEKGSVRSSSNSSNNNGGHGNDSHKKKIRKTDRLRLYYSSMRDLNQQFTSWAEESEQAIMSHIQPDTFNTTHSLHIPNYHLYAVDKYIRLAAEIKRKYNPPTGDVLTFGTGDFGQLGHQYAEEAEKLSNTPKCVMSLRNSGVTSVACGGLHSLGVTSQGNVLSWGCNDEGSLGIVGIETAYTPMNVRGFVASQHEVAKGLQTVVATWRNVIHHAEKHNRNLEMDDENYINVTNPTTVVNTEFEEKITSIASGACQSLCLSSTGRVYFFGSYRDKDGKPWKDAMPADDPRIHPKPEAAAEISPIGVQHWPIHVWQMDGEVSMIDCGVSFNAAIVKKKKNGINFNGDTDGESVDMCYTWGIGECGELARPVYNPIKNPDYVEKEETKPDNEGGGADGANETTKDTIEENAPDMKTRPNYEVDKIRHEHLVPKPVVWADPLIKRTVLSIGCGGYHLLVISKNLHSGLTSVHSSGLNNYGQLGLGDSGGDTDRKELNEIEAFRGKTITQVSAGLQHSLALESNGSLYAFGRADSGQLGNSSKQPKAGDLAELPVSIYLVENQPNPPITKIASGDYMNLALTGDGDVYSWGYGDNGALGHEIDDMQGICDECRPRKMEVLKKINAGRRRKGKSEMTAIVHDISSGGQHSGMICSLLE